jgi:hypothetical protein
MYLMVIKKRIYICQKKKTHIFDGFGLGGSGEALIPGS